MFLFNHDQSIMHFLLYSQNFNASQFIHVSWAGRNQDRLCTIPSSIFVALTGKLYDLERCHMWGFVFRLHYACYCFLFLIFNVWAKDHEMVATAFHGSAITGDDDNYDDHVGKCHVFHACMSILN